jgi:hypothetical protein
MKRLLPILKWVPLGLMILLLIAWPLSFFLEVGIVVNRELYSFDYGTLAKRPSFNMSFNLATEPMYVFNNMRPPYPLGYAGRYLGFVRYERAFGYYNVPIPFAMTMVLPLACLLLGRSLPLWSYFAYTALIAAELAYYIPSAPFGLEFAI